ncbi:WecB/TagA/CpsF family glycosyltransferase [uncultured Tyzzerella sp.]|uniref:WecB/TagA/CpsF family glycosyltransferase n=1 Tax=uncultured Tyzzerella sp. TaxID=2321398 RepID=UPI0029430456|nr:WecB/TagA/CpsF family glycosyltransferase [uncultured Tyzzerella sp.]
MSFTVCNILGVPINNVNLNEAIGLVLLYLEKNEKKIIFTPNPEFIINAINDREFMEILNKSDLNIADGIGVVIGARMLGYNIRERVPGFDLVQGVFSKIKNTDKTVYFLGASEETITTAKEMMEKKYKGIKIVGTHNGYFKDEEGNIIIEKINELNPDLLLVGLGSPRQEKWIYNNKDKLNVKVMIGVGGSFDVMSGNVKRAPKIFIKLNLEWFYRLITQPTRFKRMLKLPLFIIEVLKYKIKGGKNEGNIKE